MIQIATLGIYTVVILFAILQSLGALKNIVYIPGFTFAAAMLGLSIVVVYLLYPARKKKDAPPNATRGKIPWYDFILILCGLVSTGYLVFFRSLWAHNNYMGAASTLEIVLCIVLIIVILEAVRRVLGLILALITVASIGFVFFQNTNTLPRLISQWYYGGTGLIGGPVVTGFTVILAFLLFGAIFQFSPAGKFLVNLALLLTGRFSGGAAKASVAAAGLVGTLTGIGAADAAISGTLTIPLMKKTGYTAEFAGGVEAVASGGGTIMPPVMGIAAFIMAGMLKISYWEICLAAFIPAILYYLGVFSQVHFASLKMGRLGLSREDLPTLSATFKEGWMYLIPIAFLVYGLAFLNLPAQFVGIYTAFIAIVIIVIDWQRKKETRRSLIDLGAWVVQVIKETGAPLLTIAVACSAAGIVTSSFDVSGIGFKLSMILQTISGNNVLVLLILMFAVAFVMGMGLPGLVIYLLLAAFMVPTLTQMGVVPIAAHMFILYAGLTSLITPPVAMGVFVAASIAKSDYWKTAIWAVRLGILTFIIPFVFVFNPALLLVGSPMKIVFETVKALIAVIFLSSGIEGFFLKKLSRIEIALFIGGSVLLIYPNFTLLNGIGLAIILATVIYQFLRRLRSKSLSRETVEDKVQ